MFSLLVASLAIWFCFFFLFLISSPAHNENVRLRLALALAIPTGIPIAFANDAIEMLPLPADKTIQNLSK